MRLVSGHNDGVLDVAVDAAMVEGMRASPCKVMFSLKDGSHGEAMLPPGTYGRELHMTHCYINLEQHAPELPSLLVPPGISAVGIDRVNAYVSPAGTGAPLHFDTRTVIIVQLVGSKLWQLSETPAVESPHRNCVAPIDSQSVDYDGLVLHVPTHFRYVLLRPGDWLFVRKATWHATLANKGSISATLAAPASNAERH